MSSTHCTDLYIALPVRELTQASHHPSLDLKSSALLKEIFLVRHMRVMTNRAVHADRSVCLGLFQLLPVMAVKAETLRFRHKEELVPGTVGFMTDPAAP